MSNERSAQSGRYSFEEINAGAQVIHANYSDEPWADYSAKVWARGTFRAALRAAGLADKDLPLSSMPRIGQNVRFLTDSASLAESEDAPFGAIGVVVAHSRLASDDTGVLVRFGSGEPFRCDLSELAAADV